MKKRILALLMAGVFVLSTLLVGCGNDGDKTKNDKNAALADEGPWYKAQYHDFTLEENEYVANVCVYDGAMYFVTQKYLEETGDSITKVKKMSIEDYSITELSAVTLDNSNYVMDMYVNENGVYLATQLTEWDSTYSKLLKAEYKIVQCDFDGNEVASIDLTDEMMTKGEEGYPAYLSSMVCDKDGNIVVSDNESFLMAYDKDGNKIADIEVSGWGSQLFVGENGQIYYSYMDEVNWEQLLVPVDIAGNKLGDKLADINAYNASNYYVDENSLLWMSEENTLSTYNFETEEKTEVLNWLDYDINGSRISTMKMLDNGNIFLYTENWDEDGVVCEVITLEESDEPIADKTVITYATFGTDSEITEAIIRFNKNNEDYRIKVVDYYDDEDYEAGLNAYNEAILNGEMADLVNVDWTQYKSLARKGLYADLNEYMNNDADINREDYFENVLSAYEVDGKLYAMPMSFAITTFVGKTSVWGDKTGITMQEMVDAMNSMPGDVALTDYMTKSYWLNMALQGTMDKFIDWETGECSFDSEDFIAVLEMANKFPEDYNYESDTMSTPEKIQSGKILLYNDSYTDITGYQVSKAICDEDITAVGYPGVGGNGSLIQNMGSLFAISDQSDNKEGAWEFVKYMISEDYQKSYINWYNPIHKEAFEEQLEDATRVETYKNENGEEVEAPKMTYGWENFEISVYHATEEDVAEYRALVEGATELASYDEEIMTMIEEEVEAFFKGQKTAKDVATIIQGRVKIYVNENK